MLEKQPGAWRAWRWLPGFFLLIACQAADGPLPSEQPWRTPELKKAHSAAEFEEQIAPLVGSLKQPKVIFIGVYGGNPPPWDDAAWFDPRTWSNYRRVNLQNESALNRIAYHDSLMHVVALQVGQLFPNSVTLMIRGDSDVVSDVIRAIYNPGDRLLLAGHSFGGRVVGEVVRDLAKKAIAVDMVAYIESFWSNGSIPANVRHAFNFYVPASFAVCPGLSRINAEDEQATQVINIAVPDPVGPYSGFCAEHRNIDSDPRAWKPIVEFLRQQAVQVIP